MHRLSARLLLGLLLVSVPLLLSGNGSLVVLEKPQGAITTSSCASAGCDNTGEKERFHLDQVEQKVTSLPAQIEENVTNLLALIDADSNSKNPFRPHALPGATLELGIEDLLFQIDEQYKQLIAIAGHAGFVNGGLGGGRVQAGVSHNITNGNAGFTNGSAGFTNGSAGFTNGNAGFTNGNAGVTTAARRRQHANQDTHRHDESVGPSNPGNSLAPTATGNVPGSAPPTGGPGTTPGPDDLGPISYFPTEEFLTDPVGLEFAPSLPAADRGNDVPSGSLIGAVPEPGTLVVFALGLAGLAIGRRKRTGA